MKPCVMDSLVFLLYCQAEDEVHWYTFHLGLDLFFQSFSDDRPKFFWNDQKKLSQFGHNVWKGRLVNIVIASFNAVMDTNDQNVSAKKRNQVGDQ